MSECASFGSLPLEIIDWIIACAADESDWQSVKALSCVNRRLREMCLPVLWEVSFRLCALARLVGMQLNSNVQDLELEGGMKTIQVPTSKASFKSLHRTGISLNAVS
jgi:hypothetical protein